VSDSTAAESAPESSDKPVSDNGSAPKTNTATGSGAGQNRTPRPGAKPKKRKR
jgi:hypothetical protein